MGRRRVVVTGGAGFIGSHVVDVLAQDARNEIVVVDDFSTGREENLAQQQRNSRVFVQRADIRDAAAMSRLLTGADIVFHLAVQCLRLSLFDPMYVHEVNATGTLTLCMAARERAVRRFVYVSSSEVYGTARRPPMREDHPLHPTTPYAASKLAGEQYALSFMSTHGMAVSVVRPFNSYGPREHHEGASGEVIPRFAMRVLCGQAPVVFGDGEQTRDFTWVEDTARGIVSAGECDRLLGRVVNVACGREVTVNRIAELVLAALGRTDLAVEHAEARAGDVRRHLADIRRARRLLRFEPTVAIEDGIPSYVAWLRARIAARHAADERAAAAAPQVVTPIPHAGPLPQVAAPSAMPVAVPLAVS